MIKKVARYQHSALFITFKNQSTWESPFYGAQSEEPGEHVAALLNGAGPEPERWSYICDFKVQMRGSQECKTAMLFCNSSHPHVDVAWVDKYRGTEDV